MASYAQVTLVGVDLDHVTTSRHNPQAAEYGGTVTLRARSQGIDFTYAYPFSNKTSVLDAIDGAKKPAQRVGFIISRVYGRDSSRAGCDRPGRSEHGRYGGRSIRRTSSKCHTPDGPPFPFTHLKVATIDEARRFKGC
jgi:hypothetical protein